MNKVDFLNVLKMELHKLPNEEVDEILYDYEEHFNVGLEKGKTEEEIIRSLGDPKNLAKAYKASAVIESAHANPTPSNVLKAVIAAVSLGFFNLIFVLGPFLGVVGVLAGLFAAAIGLIFGGIIGFVAPFAEIIFRGNFVNGVHPAAAFFLGIGITALGILFFLFDIYIGKMLFRGTVKYIKWNAEIIKK
ncbi:HAAS signaling domain-containing protein [Geosporobacter ferrireducens]|uniref:DUF1700 domain-containing protein n=1 Tax=Geosporobacter ferrireducens TaxID=1424294 RepID=A0A1D8GKH4_9FIRM|nr:DUF1700 domain-containing protein [Geosporobacter ferrireducens]AOT71403.1 hypothetical protein Gferi_18850 [Geosporobacter ferrireducens]MTI57708.1 DUF1700 domain-containing protein [Geosporobacter ferrireducens]